MLYFTYIYRGDYEKIIFDNFSSFDECPYNGDC